MNYTSISALYYMQKSSNFIINYKEHNFIRQNKYVSGSYYSSDFIIQEFYLLNKKRREAPP